MSFLKNRRFQLESHEERTLLTAAPWSTGDPGDPAAVTTMIVVTDAIPTVTEIDDPSADPGEGVNAITSAQPGDSVYVSVYVQSTDSAYGVQGGYCTLYFDNAGFTAGAYTASSIMNTLTMLDTASCACSTEEYISKFGGFPSDMAASFGKTQWALTGTQEFTVNADATGDYEFSIGYARNAKGNEKPTDNFVREDYAVTYNAEVDFAAPVTFTVEGDEPVPTPITVTGIETVYDGGFYSVAIEGLQEYDVVAYSLDGETYDLTELPAFSNVGTYTTYVKATRGTYESFGNADVVITPATIADVTVSGIETAYDGGFYSVAVEGLQEGDAVAYSLDGETYDLAELPSFSNVGTYTTYVKVSRANYNDFYGDADVVITPATITDVTVTGIETFDDGGFYSVAVEGLQEGDVVAYSLDGEVYDLTELPTFSGVGTYTTYVKVSRENYNDFYASADVVIVAEPAGSLVVNTLEDIVDDADDLNSLREAVAYAQTLLGDDVAVTFEEGLEGTITLANGAIVIDGGVFAIDGADVITIDASGASRIFEINAGEITIAGFNLVNGFDAKAGGAVYNAGNLTLSDVAILNSTSNKYGGAVYTALGTELTVTGSEFTGNYASSHGGAIFVEKEAVATISDSYFSANKTVSYGAAIYMWTDSTVAIETSLFIGNKGPNGTIRNHAGNLTLASVALSGNNQALASSEGVNVGYNVTISNSARSAIRADQGASYEFYNSIIVGKKLYETDSTVEVDGDYNLSTEAFGTNYIAYNGGDLFAADGYTLAGQNQAFNAGNNDYVLTDTDAVGKDRIIDAVVDLGAVEQIGTATGKTVVYDGTVQDLVQFDGPVTWAMYSEDGEDWSDEYTYKDAGTYNFYVWCGDDYGAEAVYEVTATILPLQLTVSGSTVKTKGADGTTDATVIVGDVATLYDDVTVTATGEFASAEIGTWDVYVTYAVSGDKAGNYIAPADEILVGEIVQKEVPSMVVTTADDVVDDTDGLISLREALTVYFGTDGNKTVTFAEDLTTISANASFELSRAQDGLVIDGANAIVFDGGDVVIFTLSQDANITFQGLTFQNINTGGNFGTAFSCGWGMQDDEWGKTVTFDGCSFLNNSATYGSVMMVTGTNVDILDCTFTGNTGSDRGVIWSLYNNLYVGGSTFENNSGTGNGGALFVDTEGDRCKDLMVKDSTFINNSTTGKGGAIYSSLEVLKLYGCTFTNNHADSEGGAVYATHWGNAYFSALTPIKVTLKDDVFEGNSSKENGGAIMVMAGNIQDVGEAGSVFSGNYATGALFNRGGAIYFDYGTGASNFNGTKFLNNSTPGDWAGMGGAVFTAATGFGTATDHQFNFNDCIFDGNLANPKSYYYAYGGAVYVGSGYNTFTNCTITNNAAYIADDSIGGGEVRGGAIYMTGGPDTRFYNCTLTNNYAGGNAEGSTWQKTQALGGAVYVGANSLHLVQCQVTDNVAYGSDSRGGGVYVNNAGNTIWWSTVANNEAAAASDLYAGGAVSGLYSIIMDTVNKGAALGYQSCLYEFVEDASGTFTADAGCYELQPGDVLFNLGGYTLAAGSVAIDGTTQTNGWFETDLNGDPRVKGLTADYGAFEYQADAITGATVTFNGQKQAPISVNSDRVTWIMYSADGEDWTDEPLSRDAGEYTFYVWCGDDDGNEFTGQVTGTITPLQLTVSGSTVKIKAYDGTTTADVVVGDVATLYDSVTVSASGEFASAEIGTWDVAVTYTVSGDKAGNYIAPTDETLTGEIKAPEAASMVVTTADDIVDATDGLISLREALTVYYGTDGNKTVTFADGITALTINAPFNLNASYDGMVIDGAGKVSLGNIDKTLFTLVDFSTANLTFKGLTFENISGDGHGSVLSATHGFATGRESSRNTITFEDCAFNGNTNTGSGSVMTVFGIDLVVKNSTFTGNIGGGYGPIWVGFQDTTVEGCTFTGNNSGAITTSYGSSCTLRVEGTTFDGNSKGGDGGAILSEYANNYIYDSKFTNNTATGGGAAFATPGGANTTSTIVIEGCEFTGNKANGAGGAVRVHNNNGNTLDLKDSTFTNNSAGGAGGAVELTGCTYSIDGCTFTGNQANGSFTDGGAIHASYGGECKINASVFEGNIATGAYAGKGGAIHFTDQNGNVVITNSTFTGNKAYAPNYYWAWGGAIFRESGSGTLSLYNCSIVENQAIAENGGDGTLAAYGGGVYMSGSGVLNLVQCLIADNVADSDSSPSYGGGLFIDGSISCAIYYCTIAGNSTTGTSNSTGGGIFNSGATTIINSIVANNEVPEDNLWGGLGADIWQNGGMDFQGVLYDPAAIVGGFTTDAYCHALQEGDILFNVGGYSLAPHSVAIDGTSRTTPPFNSYLYGKDLAGNPRVDGLTVDYGAFEYQGIKAYVVVTLSDSIPNQETSDTMPVSTISSAKFGDTVYGQVWVKSVDGSTNSLVGGYVDVNYDDAVLQVENASASSLFADQPLVDISADGVVAALGGLAAVDSGAIGVNSWALLGTVTFTVVSGVSDVTASVPTVSGAPVEALDLARIDGTIADASIVYKDASITAKPGVPAGVTVASNGANTQLVSWEDAGAASYVVAYTTDGETWTEVTAEGTSAVITGLTYGANVTYKVKAVGGEFSDTVTLNVCPMDINGDGSIDGMDLSIFRAAYATSEGDEDWNASADIDGDGFVGPADYAFLRTNWGADAGDEDLVYPKALAGLDAAFESLDADDLGVDFDVF